MPRTRSRVRRSAVGTLVAVLALALAPVSSAAYSLLDESGSKGSYQVTDSLDAPGGRCGYGPENASGVARFAWMRLKAPRVFARDLTAGRDRQTVEWRFLLQRALDDAGPWTTVKRSSWERARAHDDAPADLKAHRLSYSDSGGGVYRGVMKVRWRRAGEVEGAVSLWIGLYSVQWTVGSNDFIFDSSCTNRAD